MAISKRTKVRAALFSTLSILLLLPIAEYQRRKLFLVGTWFGPADKQTLILKPDGSFQNLNEQGNPTYEGTYKMRGFSHLFVQNFVVIDDDGRRRRYGTSETMESFDSGLHGYRVYIPLYGNMMYLKTEIEFGSQSTSNKKVYKMERR